MPDQQTTAAALDALHAPGTTTRMPARGSYADKATGAALCLAGIMRAAPDQLHIDEIVIDGATGRVTFTIPGQAMARALAAILGLRVAAYVTEVDDQWLVRRWEGHWADWPVTVQHVYREHTGAVRDFAQIEVTP